GARGGQLLLELAGHLLERANLLRLDLEDLHKNRAEAALHRRADLAFLEREGGIGGCPVNPRGLGTVPRAVSFSLFPSSLAISVKLAPFAMRSAAALAASALGKSIWRMWRRSGVT